jgi:predicted metal-dependent enzyme (double-stranded beta helix superfamily)
MGSPSPSAVQQFTAQDLRRESGGVQTLPSPSAVQQFIAAARQLFAVEKDPEKRWQKMTPLLQALIADPAVKQQSKDWPSCRQSERAQNLLFYEDPDYQFVINGLIKNPRSRTQIHDHAHNWTLYGVLDGHETIERYERLDDGSKPNFADIRQTEHVEVGPGKVDLVAPYQIHAEESGAERTVAIIVRAEKAGGFLQGRYDPANKKYWQGYGPEQIPYELK